MKTPYRLVFFASLSVLAYEVSLIRLFSIRFSYHYASLTVSISMLGLVAGALAHYLRSTRGPHVSGAAPPVDTLPVPPADALFSGLALSYPLIPIISALVPFDPYRLLWDRTVALYLPLLVLLQALPFFFYGWMLATIFSVPAGNPFRVYAADLAGATSGVLLLLILLKVVQPDSVPPLLSILLAGVAGLERQKWPARISRCLLPLVLSVLALTSSVTGSMSPYKGLMQALSEDGSSLVETIHQYGSRLDVFESPRMKSAPGLSLAWDKPVPAGTGIAVDGEIAGVVIDDARVRDRDFLFHLPAALPFMLNPPHRVMLLGSRSGTDLLASREDGTGRVDVVEENQAVAAYLRTRWGVSGSPGRNLVHGSGRRFLGDHPRSADVILLSRIGFAPAGTAGLQEDYQTTVEALQLYLSTLKAGGLLFIQTYLLPPPRYELRLFANVTEALRRYDATGTASGLVVFRSWDTVNFLVKKGRFTDREWSDIRRFVGEKQFHILFPEPQGGGPFVGGPDYGSLFREIADPSRAGSFGDRYPFLIAPTTDDRPFFHYFLKMGRLEEIYSLSGRKWAYFLFEGMALPFLLALLAMASMALFFGVCAITKGGSRRLRPLPYFFAIGFAFMFVEVFFIHRLILVFGSPVASFSATLLCLLAGAGGGSMAARLLGPGMERPAMAGAPLAALLLYFIPAPLAGPVLSCLLLVVTGMALGVYFPLGLARFGRPGPESIPLFYAANGAASVIAPPLASLMAVAWGLKILLVFGAMLYVVAILITFSVPGRSWARR